MNSHRPRRFRRMKHDGHRRRQRIPWVDMLHPAASRMDLKPRCGLDLRSHYWDSSCGWYILDIWSGLNSRDPLSLSEPWSWVIPPILFRPRFLRSYGHRQDFIIMGVKVIFRFERAILRISLQSGRGPRKSMVRLEYKGPIIIETTLQLNTNGHKEDHSSPRTPALPCPYP